MTADAGSPPRRPVRISRRGVVRALALAAVVVIVGGGALLVFRYLPALDEARALRGDLEAMVDQVREAGLGIDRTTMGAVDADLAAARGRFDHLEGLLASDPLIAVARAFPLTSGNVRGADGVVAAAGDLLDAVDDGLSIARRFVEIREAQAASPGGTSTLAQLVELMATSRDHAVSAAASVASARRELARVQDGLIGPTASVRDAMTARIDTYGPLLDTYVDASERLPAILGWDGPRRYLVLTQDPAEIRPTGGFIGSYGIMTFDRGRVTERKFQDVFPLDFPWDYPRIEPPQELADYLLGRKQPWQFADSNWSPDFPTSARDALRLYTNESGDSHIDGVIGLTTYTIDELLKLTGPVAIPEYDATIASGETTMKVLELTREASQPGGDRKAFLPAFADRLLAALLALPARSWGDLAGTADTLRRNHLLLAWFSDPADQELVARSGFDGAVRQDAGDYLFPVDANVAPATKLDILTARALDLEVSIDAVGNAQNRLSLTWTNGYDAPEAAPYRAMANVGGRILGVFSRILVPLRSRVDAVSGGGVAPVTDPAMVGEEANRAVIGAYIKVPPGSASLHYTWTSPYAADVDASGGTYRLTVQKQPGMPPGPLTITIRVPDGQRITAASPELQVSGGVATLTVTFERDIVVGLQYGS